MRTFSYAWSHSVTWQRWRSHHLIRLALDQNCTQTSWLCIIYNRSILPVEVFHCGNIDLGQFLLMWPWPWRDNLTSTAGRRRLRSSNVATCEVPRTRASLCDRSFTVAGPHLWNNLPLHLRDPEHTLLEFRRLLKTNMFCWGQRRLVTVCFCALYKSAFTLHYILQNFLTKLSSETMMEWWARIEQ